MWPRTAEIPKGIQGGVLLDSMNPLYLYKNFASLQSVVDELTNFDQRGKFIAISAHPAAVSYLVQRFGPGYFEHQRETDLRSAGWQHLGFDVVDLDGVISGLKGCGYKEPAVEDLRSHFLGSLNQHGLFGSPLDAAMFAQVRGLQIRDHSPFVVVGVLARDAHRSK